MCVPVQWVGKDGSGRITHLGGADGRGVAWGITAAEAIEAIASKQWDFYTEVAGRVALVVAVGTGANRHLATTPDGMTANNLDALPVEPRPLAGVWPQFPLSLPGLSAMTLARITRVQYTLGGGQHRTLFSGDLGAGGFREFEVPSSFFGGEPKVLRFDVMVPFPSAVSVFDPIVLTQVFGSDGPAARRNLEDAGRGWWQLDYVLTDEQGRPDPTKPERITPAVLTVRPRREEWRKRRLGIGFACSTLNVNCYFGSGRPGGPAVGIVVKEAAAPPPTSPPATVTVPNVVGQRLDLALATLHGAGFKVTVLGPADVSTNLEVESQSLTAGSSVKRGSGIIVTTRQIVAPTGVKRLEMQNVSNRQHALDIWLFDYTAGGWEKKTTIAYGATGSVDFEDGHVFAVAAVDPTMPYCGMDSPEDPDCVYSAATRQFPGDDDGVTLGWVIT